MSLEYSFPQASLLLVALSSTVSMQNSLGLAARKSGRACFVLNEWKCRYAFDFVMCCKGRNTVGVSVWLATFVWCLWHLPLSVYTVCYVALVPQGVAPGWWFIAPFRGAFGRTIIADGHCKCLWSIHPNFKFGWTGFCQIIFKFKPQIKGIRTNERVTRSKKQRFLRFFVMYWLINGYTDFKL